MDSLTRPQYDGVGQLSSKRLLAIVAARSILANKEAWKSVKDVPDVEEMKLGKEKDYLAYTLAKSPYPGIELSDIETELRTIVHFESKHGGMGIRTTGGRVTFTLDPVTLEQLHDDIVQGVHDLPQVLQHVLK